MSTQPTGQLLALLDGALLPEEAARVRALVDGSPALAEELALLRSARELMPFQPSFEPRPGFAARVAVQASGQQAQPSGAAWARWVFGGGLALAGAAALMVWVVPQLGSTGSSGLEQPQVAVGEAAEASMVLAMNGDFALAQRLELLEDLPVLQNQEALEDLDTIRDLDSIEAAP